MATNRVLFVGSHPYDVTHLVTIATRARHRLGIEPVFASVAPPDVATQVQSLVYDAGFEMFSGALTRNPPVVRNPLERARRYRDENLELAQDVLRDVRPGAVLSIVNPPPSLFLDHAGKQGIPTFLLQLWFWGDRAFQRAWKADDRRFQESGLRYRARLRRSLRVLTERWYGIPPHIVWNVRNTTIAVQGPALRDQLARDGVPRDNVVATGNPMLDDIAALRADPNPAVCKVLDTLGLTAGTQVVTYFRSHEDRLYGVGQQRREQSQVAIARALCDAAPDARIVVKIHPREDPTSTSWIAGIDPRVHVVGDEVATIDLIATSAVVVGTFSTTLLQAVAADRPTVSINLWPELDYWTRAQAWQAVERAADAGSLCTAVRLHLEDDQHREEWRHRRDRFAREQFLLDGHGTDRLVDLLARAVESPAAIDLRRNAR